MSNKGRILVVDDDAALRAFVSGTLEDEGYEVETASDATEGLAVLREAELDTVITDVHMGRRSGIELCASAAELRPDVPIIVLTAFGSVEVAVEALRAGASDFLSKPVDVDHLSRAVANQVERRQLRREVLRLKARVDEGAPVTDRGLLGESAAMQRVRRLIDRVARTDASVLIVGESGTGKELVARALHEAGPRRAGPFVALNMSAFPETLLESQLFGHVKGAFTDARTASPGLLVEADGGTLFLDEIGDMPLSLQPKLLRVLQERTVRPVGGAREVPFDVRIVAATHRDIEREIDAERFRQDLYFRLNVVEIDLPPLRTRGNDVLLLAHHLLAEHGARQGVAPKGLSAEASRALLAYPWPGNVRELSNCIERAVALADYDLIAADDLPARVARAQQRPERAPLVASSAEGLAPEMLRLDVVERAHILRVYELCERNKVHTADALGIDRKTLYRKLARYLGDDADEEAS